MHPFSIFKLASLGLVTCFIGGLGSPIRLIEDVQKQLSLSNAEKAQEVKNAFQFAWDGYYKYAFPHDEIRPLTNGTSDSRNGWGASAVDALSTAIIMDIPEVVDVILRTLEHRLLEQSKNLADVLKFAFNTPTGIPANNLNIGSQTTDGSKTTGIAVSGTLVLEWTRLSDILNDGSYAKLARRGESYLLHPRPRTSEPFPGLVGSKISIETGLFQDARVSWGGGDDSFYEYLIKMYVYDPKSVNIDRPEYYRWVQAIESSMQHLNAEPKEGVTFLMDYYDGTYNQHSGHLNCFNGGNFILGGQVLNRQDIIDYGLKLVQGCRATYAATTTGIGPESFGWDPARVPSGQQAFFRQNGFWIDNPSYNLRPEVIESYYYAWRATGDTKYQDWVWEAFDAIRRYTKTKSAFSAISDVTDPHGGRQLDDQESFLYAEVMKYCYITFAEGYSWDIDAAWQSAKDGKNKFVYNTEAHPVRVAAFGL
ncbi:maturation of Asn-linked oligosaccharides protein [Ascosphaera aggregata]|nr:maturation of Asn-linked oligosaccharides protein [Ascosphaera aggregata]